MAYDFYNSYARTRGFSARKSKTRKNGDSELVQQTFVCFREGFREQKFYNMQNRIREPRPETRCGCKARMQVHMEVASSRWIVTIFCDEHNHPPIDPRFVGMLRSHKKMTEADVGQIDNMRSVGISTPLIFGSLARQSGGYDHVGFGLRDIYNHIARRRRKLASDAKGALLYLSELASIDPWFYCKHEVDADGVLRQLFWCDGISQLDYQLFGDVVAFDATYKKNKYDCPLVIFSGVNHHNQTIVFGAALVFDESKETYVWLLEQFTIAMKGKCPVSVITDGDSSMREAIRIVFPDAHHRLCAWHLMRNATSNIGQPRFTAMFKRCMLADYEIGVFRRKWEEMVEEFGVEDRPWIVDMYEKRHMWATAHIRGKFFAGFWTTSRCEGLHSLVVKYIKSHYNLTEFLEHFERCLKYMRFKESAAEFASLHGEPVMQTHLQQLERCASNVYTREVFFLFRPLLHRAGTLQVLYSKETGSCVIYGLSKYRKPDLVWHVSVYDGETKFKCSCMRMESFGIPCDHIIAILVYLDISELPRSLVMDRWTKNAKEALWDMVDSNGGAWDSLIASRYGCLMDWGRQVCSLACRKANHFHEARDSLISLFQRLKLDNEGEGEVNDSSGDFPRDPHRVRTKGCSSDPSRRKTQRCSVCHREGHNRTSCRVRKYNDNLARTVFGRSMLEEDEVDNEFYNDEENVNLSDDGDMDNEMSADLLVDM